MKREMDQEEAEEEADELGHAETYSEYMPSKCELCGFCLFVCFTITVSAFHFSTRHTIIKSRLSQVALRMGN